ncbi:MAG: serine hydrolase domain-containing protein, partial [Propionibacteriaceae bacterium]|nr:serine hydrolase domain-containing protein [Propionibacteriaceae bacterium]
AGSATLRELAQHTSGLPGMGSLDSVRLMAEDLAGAPYTVYRQATTDSLVADVAAATTSARGTWAYSNLGLSLLGAALVRAAGASDWATLADERIFTPLSMTATQVAAPGAPAPDLLQPHNPNGSPMAGQTGTGYGPAGIGVTSTASDLARYAQALMDGTAPGVSALEPTLDITDGPLAGQQMGLAWVVAPADSGAVVWHNGMTGGMASMFALDPAQDRAVILLTNRARDLTGAGLLLLADGAEGTDGADGAGAALPAAPPHVDADTVGWVGAGVVLVLAFAWASVRSRSRLRLAGQGLAALGSLAIWVLARPFDWAPPWTLGLALGLFVGALLVSGLRWPALGWLPERWRALTIAVAVLGVIWFVAMAAFAVWVLGLGGR